MPNTMVLPPTLFIKETQNARAAMKQIDTNGWGILFVVNGKKSLQGVLTPGDIRRAIDQGHDINSLLSDFLNSEPFTIAEGTDPKTATAIIFEYLRKKGQEVKEEITTIQIPVINKQCQVTDIVTFSHDKKSLSLFFGQDTLSTHTGIHRVLLVGGAGYLGSVLTRLLLASGYKVRVLDSLLFGDTSLNEVRHHPNFELVIGDVRDIQTLHKSLYSVDAVIHLAAIVGDPASQKYPQDTIGVNYLATMTLALACKYYQINKFIFASTCSVYGVGATQLDEEAPLNPVSLYARTKIESEKGILSLQDDNFRPIIMRMSTLYGLSPRMRFDLVVNTFAKMATTEGQITIFGGEQWRPLLHVEDAALAYLQMLENSLSQTEDLIFNVGSNDQNYTINQLGKFVKEALPQTKVVVKSPSVNQMVDKRTYKVNFHKIKNILGFTPKHTVSNSLKEISQQIKSGLIKNVDDSSYYNVIL